MSWKNVSLGELFSVGSSKRVLKAQWQTSGVPFYRGREITKLAMHGSVDNELFISEELFSEFEEKYGVPEPGDIVITAIGTIGNSYIVKPGDRFYFKDASVLWLSKKSDVDSRFVNYWLKSPRFKRQLDKGNGATVDTLTISRLKSARIKIPPLPEQKRIVAILDEAFAGIDTAIANTEKNLANANELFKRYLDLVFSQRGEGWVTRPLGECFRLRSGDGLTSKQMRPGEFPVFGGNGIAGRHNQSNLSGSNVIVGRVGALCGNARYINEAIWLTDNAFKVVDKKFSIDDQFLVYVLNAYNLRQYARQAAQPVISNSSLKDINLNFPESEPEQRKIVEKLDELTEQTHRVEFVYQQKLTALSELKQSLLQKAFSGELTADNVVPITSAKKSSTTPATTSPAFAAHIMAVAYHWHESKGKNKTFGHVKAQKTLHLVEALAQIDLGRMPVKDAAGPNDFAHMRTAETWARESDFYQFVQRAEGPRGYDFVKGKRYNEWLSQALDALEPYKSTLDRVVSLLMPLDTQKAELVATAYAAWNNLLLDGHKPSEEDIVHEARDNWHRDKQQYSESQFREAIARLRDHGMVPTGTGKRVTGQESLGL